jgi:hypothetical protein
MSAEPTLMACCRPVAVVGRIATSACKVPKAKVEIGDEGRHRCRCWAKLAAPYERYGYRRIRISRAAVASN